MKHSNNTIAVAHAAPVIFGALLNFRTPSLAEKLEGLKAALIKKLHAENSSLDARLVYQAVNEAHALASLTFIPLLALPALAEEKVQKVAAWAAHQRSLLASKNPVQSIWQSAPARQEQVAKTISHGEMNPSRTLEFAA